MPLSVKRAIVAGVAGTTVMTMVALWGAPMMGMPKMDIAQMLAGQMGGSLVVGWIGHFMIGSILAVIYATVAGRLSGPPWLRGATYGLAPWLLAQLAVMPMMGMGVFSGSMVMAGGSLFGHLIYGAVVGAVYGPTAAARPVLA